MTKLPLKASKWSKYLFTSVMTKIAIKYLEGLERRFCALFKIKKKFWSFKTIEENSSFKENNHFLK